VVTIERLAAADESGAMGTAPVLASA